jgi:HAMP domain-containing protein
MIDLVKKRLAFKISALVGVIMLALITVMGIYLARQQTEEHVATMHDFLLTKARMGSIIGAKAVGTMLEEAIDNGVFTVNEAMDKDYQLIQGWDWGKAPRYHTKYDTFLDNQLLPYLDKFLEDRDFAFAIAVDGNGYAPVHNTVFQKPLTGNVEIDSKENRTKRIFDDTTGLAAARNTSQGFKQVYKRDTGETMWDVSSPIYVKGQHWGGFRIGVHMSVVEARAGAILRQIIIFFGVLVVIVIAVLFYFINRSMKPVRELTQVADQISGGEGLEQALATKRIDEIGALTKALDRLRASMKAAMERLEG